MSKQPAQSFYISGGGGGGQAPPAKAAPAQPRIPASVYVDQPGFLPGNIGAASVYVGGGGGARAAAVQQQQPQQQQQPATSVYVQSGAAAGGRPTTSGAASGYITSPGVNTGTSVFIGGGQTAAAPVPGGTGGVQTGASVYVGGTGASVYVGGAPRPIGAPSPGYGGGPATAPVAYQPTASGQQFFMKQVPVGTSVYMGAGGGGVQRVAVESPPSSSPKTAVGRDTTSFYISGASGGGASYRPPAAEGPHPPQGGMTGASVYISQSRPSAISVEPQVQQNTPAIPLATHESPTPAPAQASQEPERIEPRIGQSSPNIGKVVEEEEEEATESPKMQERPPQSDQQGPTSTGNIFKRVTFSQEDEKAVRERQEQFGAPGHSGYVPLVRPKPPPAATKLAPKGSTEGRTSNKERTRSPITSNQESPGPKPSPSQDQPPRASGSPRTSKAERPKSTKSDGDIFQRAVSFHSKRPQPNK